MNAHATVVPTSRPPSSATGLLPARRYQPKPFEIETFGKLSEATQGTHMDLYKGYVMQTNAVLDSIATLGQVGGEMIEDPARPAEGLSRRLSFELGGLTLHELYFEQFLPRAEDTNGCFEKIAQENFGSIEQWKTAVRILAKTRGVGWVVTLFDASRGYLHNVWVGSHDMHVPAGMRPVFALDMWEHAWLADYGLKGREEYVEAVLRAASVLCLDTRTAAP